MSGDERHRCHDCEPVIPEGKSLGSNVKHGDEWVDGCPYALISPEVWDMVSAHADWENGITPVSTGAAPWLPVVYVDAMRTIRAANNAARAAYHLRKG